MYWAKLAHFYPPKYLEKIFINRYCNASFRSGTYYTK